MLMPHKCVSVCLVSFLLYTATPVAIMAESGQVLQKVSANGIRNLSPFSARDKWEIQWESKGTMLAISIYSANGKFISVAAMQEGPGNGKTYEPKGGEYYLEVSGTGEWTVTVVQVP